MRAAALGLLVVVACVAVAGRLANSVSVQLLGAGRASGARTTSLEGEQAKNETSWQSSGLKPWVGPDCAGPSKRLCELGVNVGDSAMIKGDIAIPAEVRVVLAPPATPPDGHADMCWFACRALNRAIRQCPRPTGRPLLIRWGATGLATLATRQ